MSQSLRLDKRQRTRERLAVTAARLVMSDGLAATPIDRIARNADGGRATFFRYFDSKEYAVAEGFCAAWVGDHRRGAAPARGAVGRRRGGGGLSRAGIGLRRDGRSRRGDGA
ncbi:TetR/AcrR family transcriptional regulator [Mycobacterium palustre]|uniref:TetR/AcrR family transcriptional regulator n=1 Tax=Mycobacterium palustre TaxID=153971 RepID=UPI0035563EC4